VDGEIDSAFEKERQLTRQRRKQVRALIPLDLDGYLFSDQWDSGKAQKVRSRIAADFTGWDADNDKFEQAFETLVNALKIEDGGRAPPEPKL